MIENTLPADKAEEYILRYSSRFLFYLIWFGGSIVLAGSSLLLAEYDWNIFFEKFPFLDNFYIAILLICITGALVFLLPFLFALKVTDKKVTVLFMDKSVAIAKGRKKITINYNYINRIKFVNITSSSKGYIFSTSNEPPYMTKGYSVSPNSGGSRGPFLYRVVIYTKKGKYKIHNSFNESWQCRRYKKYPTIYPFIQKLEKYSKCKVDYITGF